MSPETLQQITTDAQRAVKAVQSSPFDLVARAELALSGCTGLLDPALGGLPFTYAEFHTDPPVALHSPWDYGDVAGRLLEGLTLTRIMNSTRPSGADENLLTLIDSLQRDDGLMALPASPWTHSEPLLEMEWTPRGALQAWTTRFLAADDRDSLHRGQRLVHALYTKAVWEGDTCWFPNSFLPETGWADRSQPTHRIHDILPGGQSVFPLVRIATTTGNEQALELARGFIRYLRERSGAFTREGGLTEKTPQYLHSTTHFVKGVLAHGLLVGNEEEINWSQSVYEQVRALGTDFGFFPHRLQGTDRAYGDICALKDMIEIALMLGLNRDPAYLAQAEAFGRNHLLEAQICNFDWVMNGVEADFCPNIWCEKHPPEGVTMEEVCLRSLGTFASWTRMNDAFCPTNPRLMLRSTGAGMRALYDLWHYAVTRNEEAVRVDMHFSKDTRWATVRSFVPVEGHLEIMMKIRGVLAVRIPYGVTHEEVVVTVNHQRPRHETIRGGYAWLEALQNGDIVTVKWPLADNAILYDGVNEDEQYTGYWSGDTMLRLEPAGKLSPLYRRPLEMPAAPAHAAHGILKEIATL